MTIERMRWGATRDGEPVDAYVVRSASGVEARILSYGATLASLRAPDRRGRVDEVVLGFARLEGYLDAHPYLGATLGRYANRIAGATFVIDGRRYALSPNEGPNQLHGGPRGFDRALWRGDVLDGESVRLRHVSPDGDQGFPGRLEAQVVYRLTPEGALRIEWEARCDRPTVVSLSNHSYFNLRDGGAGSVLGHELWIDADFFTPAAADGVPTGAIEPVAGTALDFREPRALGARLERLVAPLGGYDHNYVLRRGDGSLAEVARLSDPETGRMLRVLTTQPAMQVYTANHLDGALRGHGGRRYGRWNAVCLETQRFPDAPNQPTFPSSLLRADEVYRQTTVYAFGSA